MPFYVSVFFYLFYVEPNMSGDLGYLGKIPFGKKYNEKIEQNYLKELNVQTYKPEDTNKHEIITVGDSFTPTSANSYANYLAHYTHKTVVNLPPQKNINPEQTAVYLLKNGFFSDNQTKVLIVESVERYFLYGLIYLDFEASMETENVLNIAKPNKKEEKKKPEKKNYLYELSSWYRLALGYENPVYKANLSNSFFSIRENKLYFYKDDFLSSTISDYEIELAKNNLKKFDSLFRANNIQLIYMVASDKYDLYQDYIVNNSYQAINTMEKFQEFEKEFYFFNTQTVLKPMLKNKVKDVYLANDSHWSYIATEAVAKELYQRIEDSLE